MNEKDGNPASYQVLLISESLVERNETSNSVSASANSSPFVLPAKPASGTVVH